jgi:hypothetical protein
MTKFLITAISLIALTLPAIVRAEEVQVGQGVICDTEKQVERFASLISDKTDMPTALQLVNKEAESRTACGVAVIAFVPKKQVANIRNQKGIMKIIEIMIVAAKTDDGWHQVSPTTQFAVLPSDEIEA